jgi:hypothetical protein
MAVPCRWETGGAFVVVGVAGCGPGIRAGVDPGGGSERGDAGRLVIFENSAAEVKFPVFSEEGPGEIRWP